MLRRLISAWKYIIIQKLISELVWFKLQTPVEPTNPDGAEPLPPADRESRQNVKLLLDILE
jgi:hypothetical protein